MSYVLATGMGLSSRARRWRESAIRSVAIAFALLLHAALLLFLLRPALPWPLRRSPSTAADHMLRVELLQHPKRLVASAPPAISPVHAPQRIHPILVHSIKVVSEVSTIPAAPPAPTQTEYTQPIAPTIPYGNSRFAHAMDDMRSSGLPQLPGDNFVSKVPGIVVAPPPSLKNRIQALGKWLRCKNSIFKRNMTDEEMLKRGVTRMQMDQDFQAHCTP